MFSVEARIDVVKDKELLIRHKLDYIIHITIAATNIFITMILPNT